MADDYVLLYSTMSRPQILPPLPGNVPRPANEEQIIAQQWERYEARGSPDTYDMVSAAVAYADEQIGPGGGHEPSEVVSGHEPC